MEKFNSIPYGSVMFKGTIIDGPGGISMANSGNMLKWIAKKGSGPDWAIYCGWDTWHNIYILQNGQKVNDEQNIRKLVNCEDEVFNLYRH